MKLQLKKFMVLSLCILICTTLFSQYTYFNKLYLEQNQIAGCAGVLSASEGYTTFAGGSINGAFNFQFWHLSDEGDFLGSSNAILSDTGVYMGGPSNFASFANSYGWAGTLVTAQDQGLGATILFDAATYQPIWKYKVQEWSNDSTACQMRAMRKMADGTYFACGDIWHYVSNSSGPETFDFYLCHLDANGDLIEDWVFDDSNEVFWVYEILELDNGKLLIGGLRLISEIGDPFLRLFNPSTGEIEQQVVWGSQWNEQSIQLKKMPDGNYYCMYDSIIQSDGGFVNEAIVIVDARLRRIDLETLNPMWDISIPIPDVDNSSHGIGIMGFEPTEDNGYVMCYNFVPYELNNSEYAIPHLVKLNSLFEIEWVNEYNCPPFDYWLKGVTDMAMAPDGGIICTGIVYYFIESLLNQRQWTFKTDACGEIEQSDCPLSVHNINKNEVVAFPNPTHQLLNIQLPAIDNYSVSVFDGQGKKINTLHFYQSKQIVLDVESYSFGLYSVVCIGKNGRQTWLEFLKE
jgi:Secretion system C-terminal sorting domain